MNNDYKIKQSDYIELKNPNFEKIKNLSESERKVLDIALQKFSSGKDVSIPLQIANKLISLSDDASDLEQTASKVYSHEISKVPTLHKDKPHTANEAKRVMWKLLGNAKPVAGKEEIIIAGQVLADGRGDWAAIRNMHKVLSKKFPDRLIRIIANSSEKWENKLDMAGIDHSHMVYSKDMYAVGADVPLDAFSKKDEILKKAQDASILISAGVSMDTVFASIQDDLKEKSIKMMEHDQSSVTAGQEGEIADTLIQAGLNSQDDRMGVFIKSYTEDFKWSNISNHNLLAALFNTNSLDENIINSYLALHECFFGYTTFDSAFIQDAIKFASKNSPEKMVVDICIPGKLDFLNFSNPNHSPEKNNKIREQLFSMEIDTFEDILKIEDGYNVGKIHFVWFEGGEKKERTVVLDENIQSGATREIRIIDPGSISSRDFKIMTNLSGPVVACTGDNSLAQALSYGKIPFYDNRFPQKWKGLLSKIENVLGVDSALYKYCMGGHDSRVEDNRDNILQTGLVEEAQQFGRYIRNEANLKPILNGVVNEKLLKQKDPDFAQKQEVLRQKYLNNSISEAELETQFKALLSEKNLI